MSVIDLKGIYTAYEGGDRPVIKNLSLSIDRGEFVVVGGPNGAGKTTLLKLLSTALKPTAGGGVILGQDLVKGRDSIRRRIGMISHNHHLYEDLTAEENLRFAAAMRGMRADGAAIAKALADVGLQDQARSRDTPSAAPNRSATAWCWRAISSGRRRPN